jgi:hypothetical protein
MADLLDPFGGSLKDPFNTPSGNTRNDTRARTSLIIEELGGQKRRVLLDGRALPHRGLKFRGGMRHEITWLPGSPDATVQILGSKLEPTQLKGRWSDRYIKPSTPDAVCTLGGRQLKSAQDCARLFDDIREQGQMLKFQWGTEFRYGIMDTFEYEYDPGVEDITWEVSLVWVSRYEKPFGPFSGNRTGLQDIQTKMSAAVSSLEDTLNASTDRGIQSNSFLDKVQGGISDLKEKASALSDTVGSYAQKLRDGATAVRSAIGQVNEGIASVTSLISDAQSQVYGELLGIQDAASATVGQSVGAYNYAADIFTTGGEFRRQAILFRDESKSRWQSELLGIEKETYEGQDLRDVSLKWYGTTEEWPSLLSYNGLSSTYLHAGQQLLIPRLTDGKEDA